MELLVLTFGRAQLCVESALRGALTFGAEELAAVATQRRGDRRRVAMSRGARCALGLRRTAQRDRTRTQAEDFVGRRVWAQHERAGTEQRFV